MGKLTHYPKGAPLPDNHPLKRGLLVFGQKRPVPSEKRTAAATTDKAPREPAKR